MKTILFLIFISLSSTIYSNECNKYNISIKALNNAETIEQIPVAVLAHYQQAEVLEKDIVGDFSLLRKANTLSKKLYWSFKNDTNKTNNFMAMIESGRGCAEELFVKTYDEKKLININITN